MGPVRRNSRLIGLGANCALIAACAGGGGGSVGGSGAPLALCEVDRVPLTLEDGSHPYLEPQSVLQVRSGFVIVGQPTYTWSPDDATQRLTANGHFGAHFTRDGRTTLIESPVTGAVDRVRAAALGGDRWGAIFAEIAPDSTVGMGRAPLRGLWYGEHDGEGWSELEPLELPREGTVDVWGATELVWTGERLVWVAPLRPQPGAIEYERRDGRWTTRTVPEAQIEVSTLAHDPRYGLLWAHFSEDPGLPEWQQSLRLYRRGAGADWELMSRVVVMPEGGKVRRPAITPLATGVTVSWVLETGGAFALVAIEGEGSGTPVAIDAEAVQVLPLALGDREPTWLVSPSLERFEGNGLKLVAPESPFGPRRSNPVAYPFTAFATTVAVSPTDVVLIGAEYEPNLFLRSLLLRLSTSCT